MREDQGQDLAERLLEDAELRRQFRDSPVEVVEGAGLELSDEQREKLEGEDWDDVDDYDFNSRFEGTAWMSWW